MVFSKKIPLETYTFSTNDSIKINKLWQVSSDYSCSFPVSFISSNSYIEMPSSATPVVVTYAKLGALHVMEEIRLQ